MGLHMEQNTQDYNEFLSTAELKERWKGIVRGYSMETVKRLRSSLKIEYTLADCGSRRLWNLLKDEDYIHTLGALTGGQAVQMVRTGLKAIYCSGWQTAADANLSGNTYPDQSLYPVNSVPNLVRRINSALRRADEIDHSEDKNSTHWYAPIVADAEAGFGGPLNAFELTKSMIEAGASGIHLEDQLATEKKCGHLGGKVLVPPKQFIRSLIGSRLAADIAGVPTVIIARTDAERAKLLTSDIDPIDAPFLKGDRTTEGFYQVNCGIDWAIARGLAYAPYADLIWCETSNPNLEFAKRFADAIHDKFPNKMLSYNCSPSFNWRRNLDNSMISRFQRELGAMGYKFQFVTLAGFHSLNYGMYSLANEYAKGGMSAYVDLQTREFLAEDKGYTASRHQHEVGTGYFDEVRKAIEGEGSQTCALVDSTEAEQFKGYTEEEKQVRQRRTD